MASLYSIATHNFSRWGFALDNTPNGKFRVGYTNMLVPKNAKTCVTPNAKHKICVTPNTKPQREPMEYMLRWVPNATFSHWPCTFHVVYAHFICFALVKYMAYIYGLYFIWCCPGRLRQYTFSCSQTEEAQCKMWFWLQCFLYWHYIILVVIS